jgi:hypothetical protein
LCHYEEVVKVGDLVTTADNCGIKLKLGIIVEETDPVEWDRHPLFFVWWVDDPEFNTCPWKPEQLKLISSRG